MTTNEPILFRTPQDALIFAFNYSMQQQGRPLAARLASPSMRTGKGLSGNDGAAQAGMIRCELQQLSDIQQAVLIARFAPRSIPCSCRNACCSGFMPNPEWSDAVRALEQAALSQLSGHLSHYRLRRRLVEKAIGVKVELNMLAKECAVSEKTVGAHWKIIREWMNGRQASAATKKAKRARTEFADIDDGEGGEPAVDGLMSTARKRADDLLSGLPFIGE